MPTEDTPSAPASATLTGEWVAVAKTNAMLGRAKLVAAIAVIDAGDLRHAAELVQIAASKLRTAAAFEYVARIEALAANTRDSS